jgi:hypothetical protein
MVNYCGRYSPPIFPVPSQMNLVRSLSFCFYMINFNIIV